MSRAGHKKANHSYVVGSNEPCHVSGDSFCRPNNVSICLAREACQPDGNRLLPVLGEPLSQSRTLPHSHLSDARVVPPGARIHVNNLDHGEYRSELREHIDLR